MTTMRLVTIVGLVLFSGAAVSAHHAFSSEFDAARPVNLKGTVTKTEWVNPHSWIHIEVKDAQGKVETWAIECGAPNSLMRRGLNKNSIPIGTELLNCLPNNALRVFPKKSPRAKPGNLFGFSHTF